MPQVKSIGGVVFLTASLQKFVLGAVVTVSCHVQSCDITAGTVCTAVTKPPRESSPKSRPLERFDRDPYHQLQNLARGPRPTEHIDFAVSQPVFNHFLIPSGGDTRHHNDARHDGVKVQKKF